ncbi:hypothetical protein AGR7C_Cc180036 [Agrobacterium deltaense Zutra 3/1]|uniref:Uncharacterized protein n=1 Tax=Agrobacterium deltaense Zutra 3/1 TaxID=1183427 RepID=A0A1S7PTE4_9HYPH|nr:hypothetical protein AGR7C_Cc180036 [Agrobacterium deltaense Zutra 3/1]
MPGSFWCVFWGSLQFAISVPQKVKSNQPALPRLISSYNFPRVFSPHEKSPDGVFAQPI